jgi:hypothetical protein
MSGDKSISSSSIATKDAEKRRRRPHWWGTTHTFTLMGFLGNMLAMSTRVDLSVAIVAMVNASECMARTTFILHTPRFRVRFLARTFSFVL